MQIYKQFQCQAQYAKNVIIYAFKKNPLKLFENIYITKFFSKAIFFKKNAHYYNNLKFYRNLDRFGVESWTF